MREKSESRDGKNGSGIEREAKMPAKDIAAVLKSWPYEPGTISVRKVSGLDGNPKVQMRLDLGLLQMELSGRPDGDRPHGHESLLDFHEQQLADHARRNGTELGFQLSGDDCQHLREEAVMYYHRYLSLSVLEEFDGVVRDTGRNLRVLDLCGKYAAEETDRVAMEQYRPYLTMMNARAQASVHLEAKRFNEATRAVTDGLEKIREFYEKFGQEESFEKSNEARVLKRFAREVQRKAPVDPMERLRRRLDRAVKDERYEEAAKLRDEIDRRRKTDADGPVSAGQKQPGNA
jgi:hypothetical protein